MNGRPSEFTSQVSHAPRLHTAQPFPWTNPSQRAAPNAITSIAALAADALIWNPKADMTLPQDYLSGLLLRAAHVF